MRIARLLFSTLLGTALLNFACQRTGAPDGGEVQTATASRELNVAEINVQPAPIDTASFPQFSNLGTNGVSSFASNPGRTNAIDTAGPTNNRYGVQIAELGAACFSTIVLAEENIATLCRSTEQRVTVKFLRGEDLTVIAESEEIPIATSVSSQQLNGMIALNDGTLMIASAGQKIRKFHLAKEEAAYKAVGEPIISLTEISAGKITEEDGEIVSLTIDSQGYVWYLLQNSTVGTISPATNKTSPFSFLSADKTRSERFHTAMVLDSEDTIYVASEKNLFKLSKDSQGTPRVLWREGYESGRLLKPGQDFLGTQVSPAVMGNEAVALVDNRDSRSGLVVFSTDEKSLKARKLCDVPLFRIKSSDVRSHLAVTSRSIFVANSFGNDGADTFEGIGTTQQGLARIDLDMATRSCRTIWNGITTIPESSPKLSLATGMYYAYAKKGTGWYVSAFNFLTGSEELSIRVGNTPAYNNLGAPLIISENGSIYQAIEIGMAAVRPLSEGVPLQSTKPYSISTPAE